MNDAHPPVDFAEPYMRNSLPHKRYGGVSRIAVPLQAQTTERRLRVLPEEFLRNGSRVGRSTRDFFPDWARSEAAMAQILSCSPECREHLPVRCRQGAARTPRCRTMTRPVETPARAPEQGWDRTQSEMQAPALGVAAPTRHTRLNEFRPHQGDGSDNS